MLSNMQDHSHIEEICREAPTECPQCYGEPCITNTFCPSTLGLCADTELKWLHLGCRNKDCHWHTELLLPKKTFLPFSSISMHRHGHVMWVVFFEASELNRVGVSYSTQPWLRYESYKGQSPTRISLLALFPKGWNGWSYERILEQLESYVMYRRWFGDEVAKDLIQRQLPWFWERRSEIIQLIQSNPSLARVRKNRDCRR